MGSLMSGWSSTVLGDDKKVRLMRNRSLTKEEVDAFWRQRGRSSPQPDDNGQQVSPLQQSPLNSDQWQRQESAFESRQLDGRIARSLPPSPLACGGAARHISSRSEPSLPAARTEEGFLPEDNAAAERPSTSCDWWTRSSWAFLNEPPHKQEEEVSMSPSARGSSRARKAYAYDQFHAARIVTGNA